MRAATTDQNIKPTFARVRVARSTMWLALLAAAAAHASGKAPVSPCSGLDSMAIAPAEQRGSLGHEIGKDLRAESERDRRANEQEQELQKGVDCIADRIAALTEAAESNEALAETRRQLLDGLLERLTTEVDALTEQANEAGSGGGSTQSEDIQKRQLVEIIKALEADTALLRQIDQSVDDINRRRSTRVPEIFTSAQSFASVSAPIPKADTHARDQLNPTKPITAYFGDPGRHITYAIAAIPDPRVPRHRREYDNAVTAISQGMLREQFVLDSYWFPWRSDLEPTDEQQTTSSADSQADDKEPPYALEDDRYGLMVFRSDGWRGKSDEKGKLLNGRPTLSLRVLLLVPETATYGMQKAALRCALLDIDKGAIGQPNSCVPAKADPPAGRTTESGPADPAGCNGASPAQTVTLFGPNFSGSMDSIREIMLQVTRATRPESSLVKFHCLRLISPSATVNSNSSLKENTDLIRYTSLARSDRNKLNYIEALAGFLGVPPQRVAIVYESTVFGLEACRPLDDDYRSHVCGGTQIAVPVNIADVRFGLRQKTLSHTAAASGQLPLVWQPEHLSLEDGAENGSEFPESQESPLTVTSTELELDRLVEQLRAMQAEMIVVIATDVRDRLFLIERIGSALGGGLFVDLGADRLLAHPDFLNATRGTLTLSSTPLDSVPQDGNGYQVWSTDEEATLAWAMEFWRATTTPKPAPASDAYPHGIPYAVSRSGLMSGLSTSGEKRLSASEAAGEFILGLIADLVCLIWICRTSQIQIFEDASNGTASWQSLRNPFLVVLAALVAGALWVTTGALIFGAAGVAIVWLYFRRYDGATLPWFAATQLVLFVALLACLILQFGAAYQWTWPTPAGSYIRWLVIRLAATPRGGLAFPLAQCVFGIEALGALWIGRTARIRWQATKAVLTDAVGEANFREEVEISGLSAGWIILSGGAATAAMGCAAYWLTETQVTVFGWWADTSMFVAVVTATFLAFTYLVAVAITGSRIKALSRVVLRHIEAVHGIPRGDEESERTLWANLSGEKPEFVATPVLASAATGGRMITCLRAAPNWKLRLSEVLKEAPITSMGLKALYAMFAAEVGIYQWVLVGVAGSSIASSLMVYLFPVTHATALIVVNLFILLLSGAYAGYHTVAFESDGLLSNVLCDRPATPRWSIALLAGVWIPFVALAIVVGIGEVPGVLQLGDGIISILGKWLKPGLL